MKSRLSKCVFKICNFQKTGKKEITDTKKRTLQKIIICQSIGCEILNEIAK